MTGESGGSSRATSRSLLARVRAQDMEAWDRLVALYAPFVYHCSRQARLGPEDSADVFQEVFRAAFARIAGFEKRAQGDTFRGWLLAITRNKVRDHFRRQRRQPRAVGGTEIQARLAEVQAAETESALDPAGEAAEQRLFAAALEILRPEFQERTWRAFLGTAVDGRPTADVGEELGMSPGAVRVARSRVLKRLRDELGD
jgi:RNA polymerase sigma-70 factor (ECF subfamily)